MPLLPEVDEASALLHLNNNDDNNQEALLPQPIVVAPPPPPQITTTNLRGLSNQGATCYLNSVLQSLYMTPEFRRHVYNWCPLKTVEDIAESSNHITLQLQTLFGSLQGLGDTTTDNNNKTSSYIRGGGIGATSTTALTQSFGWSSSDSFVQQDVMEFIQVLFDALEHNLGKDSSAWLGKLYKGTCLDFVKCLACGEGRSQPFPFYDLSLAIKPHDAPPGETSIVPDLEAALKLFLAPEKMEGDNQLDCPKCKTKRDSSKRIKFDSLPYILSIMLKRFLCEPPTWEGLKINSKVAFPKFLNMNSFLEGDVSRLLSKECLALEKSSIRGEDESSPPPPATNTDDASWDDDFDLEGLKATGPHVYELFAVLIHSGHVSGGHYYAYIKSFRQDRWFDFDDQTVSPIKESKVRSACGGSGGSTNAYMLMYRKIDEEANELEPTDDEVPEHVREVVRIHHERHAKEEAERQLRENRVTLNVFYDEVDRHQTISKKVDVQRYDTLASATEAVYNAVFDKDPSLKNVRLRGYDEYKNVLTESWSELENDYTLSRLFYGKSKTVFLQVRSSEEVEWTAYNPTTLQLQIVLYDPKKKVLNTPFRMEGGDNGATVDQLQQSLLAVDNVKSMGEIQILKMTTVSSFNEKVNVVRLTDNLQWTLRGNECDLVSGDILYVEPKNSAAVVSPAQELFELRVNTIGLRYCMLPETRNESSQDLPVFKIDRRKTLRDVKAALSPLLSLSSNEFKIMRKVGGYGYGGNTTEVLSYTELKDLDFPIKETSWFENSIVYVEEGTPLQPWEFIFDILTLKEEDKLIHMSTASSDDEDTVLIRHQEEAVMYSVSCDRPAGDFEFFKKHTVSADMPVSLLKEQLLEALESKLPSPRTVNHLRIRERVGNRLCTILKSQLSLKEASSQNLHDGRELCVEVLDAAEELGTDEEVINVAWWDKARGRLQPKVPVRIRKPSKDQRDLDKSGITSLPSLIKSVAEAYDAEDASAIQVAKPLQYQQCVITSLPQMIWHTLESVKIEQETPKTKHCTPIRINSGDLWIAADSTVIAAAISPEKLVKIQTDTKRKERERLQGEREAEGPKAGFLGGIVAAAASKKQSNGITIRKDSPTSASKDDAEEVTDFI